MTARKSTEKPVSLGHPQLDRHLEFVAARGRFNTVLATASDLKLFFDVVGKEPAQVTTADVLEFIARQREPRIDAKVVRISDGESGLSAHTIKRRLSSVSGFYAYLMMVGEHDRNPVPNGLSIRRRVRRGRGAFTPLVRAPRTLPKILDPAEVDALFTALRHRRDKAMVEAMLFGGLRRCEVLGLAMADLRPGEGRVFVRNGKGGHQRYVFISKRFFRTTALYTEHERPTEASTDMVFVCLKGPRRGQPLSEDGLEEIVRAARLRAGLAHGTCHELRHTCLTRLREAGMALEAVQAQAGHRSIESTRLYVHLANEWLADEYARAAQGLDVLFAEAVER
ncbi:MAG TPA: tyrosine-type recombinase/integrase [Acidimicrobiales bacterium]|nr:tyrosine-type recombinase/integrase [Acidimicrobiales bacterium]